MYVILYLMLRKQIRGQTHNVENMLIYKIFDNQLVKC